MKNVVKIKDRQTGEIKTAVYALNKKKNLQYNVDGTFLNDRKFDKLYEVIKEETLPPLVWKVHTRNLLGEILENPTTWILKTPLQIFGMLLQQVAHRANELNDPKLNALMCRLALYTIADPTHPDYDEQLTDDIINAATKINP